jgi:hypothetical protein
MKKWIPHRFKKTVGAASVAAVVAIAAAVVVYVSADTTTHANVSHRAVAAAVSSFTAELSQVRAPSVTSALASTQSNAQTAQLDALAHRIEDPLVQADRSSDYVIQAATITSSIGSVSAEANGNVVVHVVMDTWDKLKDGDSDDPDTSDEYSEPYDLTLAPTSEGYTVVAARDVGDQD